MIELPPDDLIDDLLKSTKDLIRILKDKENKMTEKKGNTVQQSFNIWNTDWLEDVGDMGNSLIDKFNAYETGGGTLKVTIEFYPDNADSEVEDE